MKTQGTVLHLVDFYCPHCNKSCRYDYEYLIQSKNKTKCNGCHQDVEVELQVAADKWEFK